MARSERPDPYAMRRLTQLFQDWLASHYDDFPYRERQQLAGRFTDEIILSFSDYLRSRKSIKED